MLKRKTGYPSLFSCARKSIKCNWKSDYIHAYVYVYIGTYRCTYAYVVDFQNSF